MTIVIWSGSIFCFKVSCFVFHQKKIAYSRYMCLLCDKDSVSKEMSKFLFLLYHVLRSLIFNRLNFRFPASAGDMLSSNRV